ncbi:MAG: tonB-system energizer ExbB [Alcanivoracaceae bacterium]|nr:tonB-system energizer ExbB [Alcanivoracaceae bacterium]
MTKNATAARCLVLAWLVVAGIAPLHADTAAGNGENGNTSVAPVEETAQLEPVADAVDEQAAGEFAAAGNEVSLAPAVDRATLPHDLSPMGMFLAADWVVKAVMIGLLFASVVTWTVWLFKSIEMGKAMAALRGPKQALASAATLKDALPALTAAGPLFVQLGSATEDELHHSAGLPAEGTKERLAMRLSRIEAEAGRKLNRGTGVLATIGSTAPFVGLFGTVWGIMNSFIGISQAQTTNLSVVAPGIAEALLATALGLVAAIPAVMIYNVFARGLAEYRGQLGDVVSEILRVCARDLDRGVQPASGNTAAA